MNRAAVRHEPAVRVELRTRQHLSHRVAARGRCEPANCAVKSAPSLPNDQANNPGNVACLNATFQPQRRLEEPQARGHALDARHDEADAGLPGSRYSSRSRGSPYVGAMSFPHLRTPRWRPSCRQVDQSTQFNSNATKAELLAAITCRRPRTQVQPARPVPRGLEVRQAPGAAGEGAVARSVDRYFAEWPSRLAQAPQSRRPCGPSALAAKHFAAMPKGRSPGSGRAATRPSSSATRLLPARPPSATVVDAPGESRRTPLSANAPIGERPCASRSPDLGLFRTSFWLVGRTRSVRTGRPLG